MSSSSSVPGDSLKGEKTAARTEAENNDPRLNTPWIQETDIVYLREAVKALGSPTLDGVLDTFILNAKRHTEKSLDGPNYASIKGAFRVAYVQRLANKELDNFETRQEFLSRAGRLIQVLDEINTRRSQAEMKYIAIIEEIFSKLPSAKPNESKQDVPTSPWLNNRTLSAGKFLDEAREILEGRSGEKSHHHQLFVDFFEALKKLRSIENMPVKDMVIQQNNQWIVNPKAAIVPALAEEISQLLAQLMEAAKSSHKLDVTDQRSKFYESLGKISDFSQEVKALYKLRLDVAKRYWQSEGKSVTDQAFASQAPVQSSNIEVKQEHPREKKEENKDLKEKFEFLESQFNKVAKPAVTTKTALDELLKHLKEIYQSNKTAQEKAKAIHFAVMKVYLIDAYLVERDKGKLKTISKGDLSKHLDVILNAFTKKFSNSWFQGAGHEKEKGNKDEAKIMTSVVDPEASRALTKMAFSVAMIEGLGGKNARRLINAEKMVIGIESKDSQISPVTYWNDLVHEYGNSKYLLISTDPKDKSRKEDNIKENFEKNINGKNTELHRILPKFYPAIMATLLKNMPEDAEEKLTARDKLRIDSIIEKLEKINQSPSRPDESAIADFYRTMMNAYIEIYLTDRDRTGSTTVKSPLLLFLEKAMNTFQENTYLSLFGGIGAKDVTHNLIFGSVSAESKDEAFISMIRKREMAAIVQNLFDNAMRNIFNFPVSFQETAYANTLKVLDRMGWHARLEWNKLIEKAVGLTPAKAKEIVDNETKRTAQQNERRKTAVGIYTVQGLSNEDQKLVDKARAANLLFVSDEQEVTIKEDQSRKVYHENILQNQNVADLASRYLLLADRAPGSKQSDTLESKFSGARQSLWVRQRRPSTIALGGESFTPPSGFTPPSSGGKFTPPSPDAKSSDSLKKDAHEDPTSHVEPPPLLSTILKTPAKK